MKPWKLQLPNPIADRKHSVLLVLGNFESYIVSFVYGISLTNSSRGVSSFVFNREHLTNFLIIYFINILNLFLENSLEFSVKSFGIKSFNFFLFSSQNWISIRMKGFRCSNELCGTIKESSKAFVDLVKSIKILLMNYNG